MPRRTEGPSSHLQILHVYLELSELGADLPAVAAQLPRVHTAPRAGQPRPVGDLVVVLRPEYLPPHQNCTTHTIIAHNLHTNRADVQWTLITPHLYNI